MAPHPAAAMLVEPWWGIIATLNPLDRDGTYTLYKWKLRL
jgi:MoxR-like ATPase